jgi:large subunit ribosomal protein L23
MSAAEKKETAKAEGAAKKRAAKTAAKAEGRRAKARKSAEAGAVVNTSKYNSERLMTVLLAPVISEKATFIADKHEQVVFRVAQDATKPEIKAAVELMFSKKDKPIEVVSVQVANVKGKQKRFGQYNGRRRNWKKAYVSLKAGQEINFAAEV